MPKESTLLSTMLRNVLWSGTLAVCLALVVGAGPALADPPLCGDGVCQGNEPQSCPADCDGGGGGQSGGEYDVTFSGDLSFAETLTGVDGGGRRQPVNVYYQFPELDLGFFFDKFGGADSVDGERCFAGADWHSLGSAISIYQLKDDSAQVRYWFGGFGRDGTTPVKYQLVTHGGFDDPEGWPPATGEQRTVVITDWRMETESKKVKNACRSELFTESIVQQITATRTN